MGKSCFSKTKGDAECLVQYQSSQRVVLQTEPVIQTESRSKMPLFPSFPKCLWVGLYVRQ